MATKKTTKTAVVAKAPAAVKTAPAPVTAPVKKTVAKPAKASVAVKQPVVKTVTAKKPAAKQSLSQKKADANAAFKDLVAKPATTAAAAAPAVPEANTPAKIADAVAKRGVAGANVKRRKVAKDAFAKKKVVKPAVREISMSCKDVGRTLRELRVTARLTQSQLAAKTSLAPSTISEIETGRQALTVDRLYQLVDALGFTLTLELVPTASK
jgi:ribosome-binding protein aMBF1 (putative translation factor)